MLNYELSSDYFCDYQLVPKILVLHNLEKKILIVTNLLK